MPKKKIPTPKMKPKRKPKRDPFGADTTRMPLPATSARFDKKKKK